jgi:hypothetical protein
MFFCGMFVIEQSNNDEFGDVGWIRMGDGVASGTGSFICSSDDGKDDNGEIE